MGRIILGPLLNDIRNRVGTSIFSIYRGIHYTRTQPVPIANPNTADQIIYRNRLRDAVLKWFGTLTKDQRSGWDEYAQSIGSASDSERTQGEGQVIHFNRKAMTGFGAYVMINQIRRSIGVVNWTNTAPFYIRPPQEPSRIESYFYPPPTNRLKLSWTDPPDLPADGKIRVWCRSWAWAHAQIVGVVAKGVQTYEWDTMKGASGVSQPLKSGMYHMQCDAVTFVGVKSAGSVIIRRVISVT